MILSLLDVLAFVLDWGYVLLFFWMLHTFLPVRKPWPLRLAAVVACSQLAVVVIYSNDLAGLLGAMAGFFVYVAVFHRGQWMKKAAAVLVFYPALIAVNYLMQDAGAAVFFAYTGAPGDTYQGWTESDWFWSTLIHTLSLLARLGFWVGAWVFLRRKLQRISESLTASMWWMVDAVMLAPFVCIVIIIYFMPENMAIVYPVCLASIFSSFGCVYVAAYICDALQDRYRAQALEKQQAYYRDRLRDEERVRSIYHDMKNHLTMLQAFAARGETDTLTQYLSTCSEQLVQPGYVHTGNPEIDGILNYKLEHAHQLGAKLELDISLPERLTASPFDLNVILGNLLDNAVEGLARSGEKRLSLSLRFDRGMLFLRLTNTYDGVALKTGELEGGVYRSRKDESGHGLGLSIVRRTVEKYHGQLRLEDTGTLFTAEAVLYLDS